MATTIDNLIRGKSPRSIELLRSAAETAQRRTRRGAELAIRNLRPFADTGAFREQSALLGLRGRQEQEAAIAGIPVSEFDLAQEDRQRRQLLRRAAAAGQLGGGATFQAAQQLGGSQAAQRIFTRLEQLEPLATLGRGVASTISGIREESLGDIANIRAGLGGQIANIRLGAAAPIIQQRASQAQLAGLQGIARARTQGQALQQVAGLAGQTNIFGLGNLFRTPEPSFTPISQAPQVGIGTSSFNPSSNLGLAQTSQQVIA